MKADNAVIEMLESVMKAQFKSNVNMLELEEKRLQMEEAIGESTAKERR